MPPKIREDTMTTTKTRFGHVDAPALQKLREEFDTWQFLTAIDKLDQLRYQIDDMRDQLMALHGMASYLINDNFHMTVKTDASDIHDLTELVGSGADDMFEAAEIIQTCTDAMRTLDSEDALAMSEGWEEPIQ